MFAVCYCKLPQTTANYSKQRQTITNSMFTACLQYVTASYFKLLQATTSYCKLLQTCCKHTFCSSLLLLAVRALVAHKYFALNSRSRSSGKIALALSSALNCMKMSAAQICAHLIRMRSFTAQEKM